MWWLYVILALPVLRLIYDYLAELNFRRLQYKHGCEPPRELEKSVPFGIPALFKFARSYSRNEFHEATQNQYLNHHALSFREQSLGRTLFNTIEPENIKAVLATKFKNFDLASRHDQFQPLMGDGIFTLSGYAWQHSRAMLRPQFTTQQISQLTSLDGHCAELIEAIKSQNYELDVQALFFRLTLDSATEFLFGQSTCSLTQGKGLSIDRVVAAEEFANDFATAQKWALWRTVAEDLHWIVDGVEYRRAVDGCHRFVDYYVNLALNNGPRNSEDEPYVFLRELTKETQDPIVLRDQAMSVLLAGRDTTAGVLSFAIALMLRNTLTWGKLREAVLQDFGTGTERITFQSLKKCQYLQHVIHEVLRLYPVVPINSRQATVDTVLPKGGGEDESMPVFIPKGTVVQYHTYTLHRHVKFWGDDADQFKPERWERARPQAAWEYIPFNGGPRICQGMNFALTETGYVLVRLAQSFIRIEPLSKLEPIKQVAALTSSVAGGVPVKFIY